MLEGEILYRKGEYDKAFQALKEAVTLDDSLMYVRSKGRRIKMDLSLVRLYVCVNICNLI